MYIVHGIAINRVIVNALDNALNKEARLQLRSGQSRGKFSASLQGLPSSGSCRTSEENDLKHGELELTDTELIYIWKTVKRCQKRNGVNIFR